MERFENEILIQNKGVQSLFMYLNVHFLNIKFIHKFDVVYQVLSSFSEIFTEMFLI